MKKSIKSEAVFVAFLVSLFVSLALFRSFMMGRGVNFGYVVLGVVISLICLNSIRSENKKDSDNKES